ncbi:sigma-54 interaction domain-containing protein [Marinobacter lacisalsi]|uniref:Sigma-54 interaction domain-containing protein n=1 Tax=Marinobacter lacisalsi TaxID=475979 RepID=A0ABV8QF97_9GAMM
MSPVEYGRSLETSAASGQDGSGHWPYNGSGYASDRPGEKQLEVLFGPSPVMKRVMAQVRRVAPTSATVLITGESGTGKEVIARAIHDLSDRCGRPFVPVNCGAISPQLIESELFGHEKGSFTGAVRTHRGVFEQADGGTLFLDEITEMPIELQVKLLRVLETRRFVRVGSDHEQNTDIRILAATNRCPEEEVASGKLRSDLLYRLQVFPIELPGLRERKDDIGDLARFFLQELNDADGNHKAFSDEALRSLEEYWWPGNIRELRNVVQRAYIMADHVITSKELPPDLVRPVTPVRQKGHTLTVDIGTSVAEVERNLIFATLDQCGGRKEKAANILGVSMKTLYNRLRKYEQTHDRRVTDA